MSKAKQFASLAKAYDAARIEARFAPLNTGPGRHHIRLSADDDGSMRIDTTGYASIFGTAEAIRMARWIIENFDNPTDDGCPL